VEGQIDVGQQQAFAAAQGEIAERDHGARILQKASGTRPPRTRIVPVHGCFSCMDLEQPGCMSALGDARVHATDRGGVRA
jgi:hypothetical protein